MIQMNFHKFYWNMNLLWMYNHRNSHFRIFQKYEVVFGLHSETYMMDIRKYYKVYRIYCFQTTLFVSNLENWSWMFPMYSLFLVAVGNLWNVDLGYLENAKRGNVKSKPVHKSKASALFYITKLLDLGYFIQLRYLKSFNPYLLILDKKSKF